MTSSPGSLDPVAADLLEQGRPVSARLAFPPASRPRSRQPFSRARASTSRCHPDRLCRPTRPARDAEPEGIPAYPTLGRSSLGSSPVSTLQRLADRGLVKPPRWLPANVQYET